MLKFNREEDATPEFSFRAGLRQGVSIKYIGKGHKPRSKPRAKHLIVRRKLSPTKLQAQRDRIYRVEMLKCVPTGSLSALDVMTMRAMYNAGSRICDILSFFPHAAQATVQNVCADRSWSGVHFDNYRRGAFTIDLQTGQLVSNSQWTPRKKSWGRI